MFGGEEVEEVEAGWECLNDVIWGVGPLEGVAFQCFSELFDL